MEEVWVVYLCIILFVLIFILMKQKPDDEIKRNPDNEKPSTSYSQLVSGAGRVLEYTEEELEASMQKLSGLLDHPESEKAHHTAPQNILDEIEQAVQETADTEVYVRRRPQPPVPKQLHEETQW
ncbi:hypothetical protein Chor_015165 [Crotalus horridus]